MEGDIKMKTFWKTFILSVIFFTLAIYLGSYSYTKVNKDKIRSNINTPINTPKKSQIKVDEDYSSLEEALKESKRINVLLLGLEDIRTDTIIFASFHPDDKKVDIISIPRDTYIHRKGYNAA